MLEKSRLLRPLLFLKVDGANLKKYRVLYPLLYSVLALLYLYLIPQNVIFFGMNSMTDIFSKLLQFLPGFYIAALAAIASFNRAAMDKYLSGETVTLSSSENGKILKRKLTRRRFLSLLFGYLSFSSLILVILCTVVQSANPHQWILNKLGFIQLSCLSDLINGILFFPILFIFCQLICLTLLGLFYLSDRMHWKDEESYKK